MREIKFRAWTGDRMIPHEYCDVLLKNVNNTGRYSNNFIYMQFTGLKDKNGGECYISDIIKDHNGRIYLCKMSDEYLEMYFQSPNSSQALTPYGLLLKGNGFEIIGNIYESPELITK